MTLLDPDFIRRLEQLRLQVRRKLAGAGAGARRSTRRGASVEFADHRAYSPGDDLRRVDWNAYARLGELILRLYVAEEDITVYLLVDTSRSLDVGEPKKIEVAKRMAAALGYLALAGSERVSIVPFSDRVRAPFPPARGRKRVAPMLKYLDALTPDGETNLDKTVETFLARRPRKGLVVVLSDLLDPGGYARPLDRLIAERHEVAVFHILDPSELEPEQGDFVLVDSERGTRVDVSVDARVLAAYRKRLEAFLAGARAWAKKRGAHYSLVQGHDLEAALLEYLRAG